ncbi:hypothetical protein [Burkholderia anthina]|uniref:hypothetical protein n=1 Tax=Burkholderia anthina TaxID=179879 RepID=UPI001AA07375|nr:hypothetical protein [Burkholderia anthina]QTD91338.1 hypothetical protein J4G50_08185 [Burkholderia anthina]
MRKQTAAAMDVPFSVEDITGNNYEYTYKLGDWASQNDYDGIDGLDRLVKVATPERGVATMRSIVASRSSRSAAVKR